MKEYGVTVWLTGLSGAGKTTIAKGLERILASTEYRVALLDGDELRHNLTRDLGFTKEDRDENIRRIGFVAHLLTRNGIIVLVSAISPYRETRQEIRRQIGNFIEVYVNSPVEICEQRDVKGLYRKARAGEIKNFTGISDPYEAPIKPEVNCRTNIETEGACIQKILLKLQELGYISGVVPGIQVEEVIEEV